MVPALAVQLTFGFIEPLTVAVYCQLAPTPIVLGGAPVMLTVTCCWEILLGEEPPQAASERRAKRMTA
jgi:hypothetical protein